MDYKEKYEMALEGIQEILGSGEDSIKMSRLQLRLQGIFPELKESEGKDIKQFLIDFIKVCGWTEKKDQGWPSKEKCIAWLEKQGEQKPTDKVEPKFKVGDIITNGKIIGKVDENENNKYHGWFGYDKDLSVHYADIPDIEDWHLWTIQDAKAGDVLCCESGWTCIFRALDNHTNTFSSYCFMDSDKWFCNTGCTCHTLDEQFIRAYNFKLHPATKEQRDLLFQKMHEAGYEWDAKKKELKEIEQKPAWSEEDDEMLNSIIEEVRYTGDFPDYPTKEEDELYDECLAKVEWLKSLKDRVQPQSKQEWSEEDDQYLLVCKNALAKYQTTDKWDASVIYRWLVKKVKSLRPQSTWKPSDEQIEALDDFIYAKYPNVEKHGAAVKSLYQDLKKLREE